LLDKVRPTHLLHLAWITQPGVFWSSHENLTWLEAGTRLAHQFFESGGERFVGLGSCAEYETTDSHCVEDRTPINPITVYGKAKAAMHLALHAAAQHRGGGYAWGRLFFPYGPGEAQDRFIPSLITGLLHGQAVDCTHGMQQRDFIFVADVAEACVALLESDRSGAYNIGSGAAISLRRIAEEIIQQLGRPDLVRFGVRTPPAFDPPCIAADIGKIRREIGWAPQTGLEKGLMQSIEALRRGSPAASAK
jgi:nucleoside-diphosphate-sugar epimerase